MLLLLIVAFALLWVLVCDRGRRVGFENLSVRGGLVLAYLCFELVLLLITELSSIGRHFSAGVVEVAWACVVVVLVVVERRPILDLIRRVGRSDWRDSVARRSRILEVEDWIWIGVVAAIVCALTAVALLYLPSNADSMVYHLARVEHWIQNRSIGPFATQYAALVELSPLAEYNLAALHLLSGSDYFDAFVQLTAAIVCIVGVSELARLLGGSRRIQIVASVICATIPTGILLATSTENDYVAAAICLGLLITAASFRFERPRVVPALAIGAAAGLGYMTKGTTPSLMWPAAFALLAASAYRSRHVFNVASVGRVLLVPIGGMVIAAAVVAGPFLQQGHDVFGSSIGPVARTTIVASYDPRAMAANVVRGTALNFDVGDGVSGLDSYVSRVALDVLGPVYDVFGIKRNDPNFALISGQTNPFIITSYSLTSRLEDYAPSPWDVLLIVAAVIMLIVGVAKGRRRLRLALVLAAGLVVGYLAFNATARWSFFTVRYNMPSFVAWSAVIALALSMTRRWVQRLVMIGLVIACLPQLLTNASRPLVPVNSETQTFLTPYFPVFQGGGSALGDYVARVEARSYVTTVEDVARSTCHRAAIGNFILEEYPLWVGLSHEGWHGQLNDINVANATKHYEVPNYRPCAVLTQDGVRYISPVNGTVTFQQPISPSSEAAVLALSVDANAAATIPAQPHFRSQVAGVRVQPGGGWTLSLYASLPGLMQSGTLYVYSDRAQTVHLNITQPKSVDRGAPSVSEDGGAPRMMAQTGEGSNWVFSAPLTVDRGVNEVFLTPGAPAGAVRPSLFRDVAITS